MAHFAQLDNNNTVINVIVVNNNDMLDNGQESEVKGIAFCQSLFGADTLWRQTSYSANFRKNYAGIGFVYDAGLDAFVPPKPYASWTLDTTICQWQAPVAYPQDGKIYIWNESAVAWIEVQPNEGV